MKRIFPLFTVFIFFGCNPSKDTISSLGAKFIFRATVEQIAAATLPEISDVSQCIIVKVNEVVSAPPGFTDWTGKSITVNVKGIDRYKSQSEVLFYTNGWLYGRSLAVVEVNSMDSQEFSNEQVLAGIEQDRDEEVQKRLKRTELVVTGEVIRISEPEKQQIDSEHDPAWVTAEIEIDKTLKGTDPGGTLSFRFPSSYDIIWENAPKFKVGDKGVWLLRRDEKQDNTFSITESEDYYPIERADYIEKLLKQ